MMNLILLSVSVLTIAAVVSPIASATSNTAIDFFEECELGLGNTQQPYDETCPNGATNLLPCNPGQLKVAECIGQSGNTSRMCDPCPQKHYQSFYNKCTRCHQCSECSPNEEISEPCTDKKDTVCRSITPPVTATAPEPERIPQSQAPTRSTTNTTTTTITNLPTSPQSVVSTKSPLVPVVTYGNVDQTTKIFSPETTTAGNEVTVPIPAYKGPSGIIIAFSAGATIVVFLLVITVYYKWKEKSTKAKAADPERDHSIPLKRSGDPSQSPSSSSTRQSPPRNPVCRTMRKVFKRDKEGATKKKSEPGSEVENGALLASHSGSGSPMSTTQSADDHIEPGGSKASPSMNLTTPTPSPGGVMSREEEIPGSKPI